MPVFHGTALSLVYSTVLGLWAWALARAIAISLEQSALNGWLWTAPHAQVLVAIPVAAILTIAALRQLLRHDSFKDKDLEAMPYVWRWLATRPAPHVNTAAMPEVCAAAPAGPAEGE